MLFDREDKPAEAKQAFAKAAELGSTNAYVHYRAAAASWGSGAQPDQTALQDMDAKLARAIQLNPAFAGAYTNLAEVRATLKKPLEEVAGLLGRAVALEPGNAGTGSRSRVCCGGTTGPRMRAPPRSWR
jgi:hypothetical protein